jgi:predicted protein tyrosine phosphatase
MAIIVCSLSLAAQIAREHRPSHAISLLDPGTPFPLLDGMTDERRLQLGIHDIEYEADGMDAPSQSHIGTILDFIRTWDREAPLLVHCFMGISRSTATAFIAACAHNPDAPEDRIAAALREASPTASPNRRFVALADVAMGRGGRMVRAIDDIGRGPPWFELENVAPFHLQSRFELAP